MAATLAGMRERVAAALMDGDHRVWSEPALDEALRLALGEYQLAGGAPVTLAGLDGAAATTLPALHETMIVAGAAGYAGTMRSVDRVDAFDPEDESRALVSWAQMLLERFRQMLAGVFPGYGGAPGGGGPPSSGEQARLAGLRSSNNPPWGRWSFAGGAFSGREEEED